MEKLVADHPAAEIEDRYRAVLRDNRARDAAAGRTLDGPHLTDLSVVHAAKDIPASDASTGEQKALLIGLVLAHAGLLTDMSGLCARAAARRGRAPISIRHDARCSTTSSNRLGAQVWMTGADPAAFAEIEASACIVDVSPGTARAAKLDRSICTRRTRSENCTRFSAR